MAMNTAYRNAIANAGAALITHIGLINEIGEEISGGDYIRQPIVWTSADNGIIRPTSNLVFTIPAGVTVAGWSGYSALTGGVDYGGGELSLKTFAGGGQLTLLASLMGILHLSEI